MQQLRRSLGFFVFEREIETLFIKGDFAKSSRVKLFVERRFAGAERRRYSKGLM
jgi:hypothetical protein